jgi:succinate-semialdehyde dehydrogenase/glutarate-semialdehyde dehydrogenase
MKALKMGPGLDPGVELGPMVNARAIKDIDTLVSDAVGKGAQVMTGGAPAKGRGYFYPATVLGRVPANAAVLREEIFGPVAPIVVFEDDDEMIAQANNTEYGLVAYLYTQDLRRGMRVAERLEAGMVGMNRGLVSDAAAPFGGVKQSGIGREGSHDGMLEFMEKKYIAVEW